MNEVWLLIGLGGFLGFFLGRWSAEYFRARFDMRRVWNQRKLYRER